MPLRKNKQLAHGKRQTLTPAPSCVEKGRYRSMGPVRTLGAITEREAEPEANFHFMMYNKRGRTRQPEAPGERGQQVRIACSVGGRSVSHRPMGKRTQDVPSFVTRREIKRQRQPISCHSRLTEATNRQLHQTGAIYMGRLWSLENLLFLRLMLHLRGGAEETAKLTDTDLQTHRRFCVQ
ncbi:hypothetical protein JZ751_013957 [Albula glossodonta]|uniref:Uncharacterized protein n=1 Tax=Albula glossodonta TaxID=121402 RepID=A0A8T2MRW1_9TELE|nr:hypothetical protein JZ751_013957 [Albula glossodonta]